MTKKMQLLKLTEFITLILEILLMKTIGVETEK